MRELKQYRESMKRLPDGCTAAEAEAEKQEILSIGFSGAKAEQMSCSGQTELFVRASGKKTGMVYTQNLEEEADKVIRQALANSEAAGKEKTEPMSLPGLWKGTAEKPVLCSRHLISAKELKDFGEGFAAALLRAPESGGQADVEIGQTICTMGIVNSFGVDREVSSCRFEAEVSAAGGYTGFLSADSLEKLTPDYFLRGMKERCETVANQPLIPSKAGVYRAVLSPEAVNNILITAWQMFSGRRALNGAALLAGKTGRQIFSPCITIRDLKCLEGGKDSLLCGFVREMDCEGAPCCDVTLVENGVLKGWMHNLSTAQAAGGESTGNAGRKTLLSGNIHTDMAIMPKNFTIEPGEASLEELFAACGDGVYVYENYDQFHALNIVTGDFAFPCKAVRICGGKTAGRMEGLTMNGNVVSLFSQAEMLGRERAVTPMTMYESYTVSGPAMLVGSLKISG